MTDRLSEEELGRLKELAGKATPGPWAVDHVDRWKTAVGVWPDCRWETLEWPGSVLGAGEVCRVSKSPAAMETQNSEYIAAANPETLLKLIAEIERLRATK